MYSWDFRTEDHDIKFGINNRNDEGVEKVVVPVHKVNSHIVNEVGMVNCEYPSTCKLTQCADRFDVTVIEAFYWCLYCCDVTSQLDQILTDKTNEFLDTVIFDNTHSMMRNKKLMYDIRCIAPSEKLDVNTVSLPEDINEENDDTHL